MSKTAKSIQEQVGQVQDLYADGRRAVSDFTHTASQSSKRAMKVTDEWVHDNPWVALGIIAGAGLLIGLLIAQGWRED